MRPILGFVLLAGTLLATAPDARALCLDFTGFCDALQVDVGPAGTVYGRWLNYDCLGAEEPVLGKFVQGSGIIGTDVPFLETDYVFELSGVFGTFSLDGRDSLGSSPPFNLQREQPFTASAGECVLDAVAAGETSTLGLGR